LIRQGYPLAGFVEEWVRFDDMLATVLARPAERLVERIALWRQLLDLLAQQRPGADPYLSREAFLRLQSLRPDVPVAIRQETARAFAGRPIPAPLAAFLAADVPAVAGAILSHVRLDEPGWLSILHRLSPTGRGFLRHRRDLGPQVESALAGFGATDLTLGDSSPPAEPPPAEPSPAESPVEEPLAVAERPAPVDPMSEEEPVAEHPPLRVVRSEPLFGDPSDLPSVEVGTGQIRAIITRIARFKKGRDGTMLLAAEPQRADDFRFEAGPDGIIRWVDGAPRGPLVGETIATPATGDHGVDAQAPGAFRRRAPFRDARLVVAGQSAAAGEWRLAGVPVFAPADGRFLGYRGVARRPGMGEVAEPLNPSTPDPSSLYGAGLEPDSLRQLVHELRTPLNAIGGFAEMIRRQMRGPISTRYRDRAQSIAEHAGQLLAAVDDLDVAARLETQRLDLQSIAVDLGAMLTLVCANHAPAAARHGAALEHGVEPGLPPTMGDPAALRRMVGRLVAASAALAGEGETIRVTLVGGEPGVLEMTVGRPLRLEGLEDEVLLDPGYGPNGDSPDAPLLGLGFSLHLVRRLAMAAGGVLLIEPHRFLLRLPAADQSSQVEAGIER
jgi:signal transduction histidine kinase